MSGRTLELTERVARLIRNGADASVNGSYVEAKRGDVVWHVACATHEDAQEILERARRIAARPLAA